MRAQIKIQRIQAWFERNAGCTIQLPDGPFSAGGETTPHSLTFMEHLPHNLILELDTQILLVFTGIKSVEATEGDLVFSQFLQCVLIWQDFGVLDPNTRVYPEGKVVFSPPKST